MSDRKSKEDIYTNYLNGKNVLKHSKAGNTEGENDVKKINDLIKSITKSGETEARD